MRHKLSAAQKSYCEAARAELNCLSCSATKARYTDNISKQNCLVTLVNRKTMLTYEAHLFSEEAWPKLIPGS